MPEPNPSISVLLPISRRPMPGGAVETVDARDLHAFLEVSRDFSTWIKDRIASFGFDAGQDYVTELFPGFGEKGQGRPGIAYFLALDMAKELAMVERNAKGKQARLYFIECERIAKAAPATPLPPANPYSPEKIAAVREARLTFGRAAAQKVWHTAGLPPVSPLPEEPRQPDLFTPPTRGRIASFAGINKPGRKPILTDAVLAAIDARIQAGATKRAACEAEGVSYETMKMAVYRARMRAQQQH